MSDPYGDFRDTPLEARENQVVRMLIQRQRDREAFDRLGGRGKVIAGYIAGAVALWAAFEFIVKAALGQ